MPYLTYGEELLQARAQPSKGRFCIMSWTTNKETHAHMKMRQAQNLVACKALKAEAWAEKHLSRTGIKWTRQAQWGFRLFDFWSSALGIAVEIDGPSHNPDFDYDRDLADFKRSGILVLRVPNWDEEAMERALEQIALAVGWNERRRLLNLKPVR